MNLGVPRSANRERNHLATWDTLIDELTSWQRLGRLATFWWRDDDAVESTPELEAVIHTSETTETSVALAAIPGALKPSLRTLLAGRHTVFVLQHGYMHHNHAPDTAKKSEFGPGRALAAMLAEISEGWRRISTLERALPVFVPPWNRYDADLLPMLPHAGIKGFSAYRPRNSATPGVKQNNTHVDIMDWRERGFVGERAALSLAVEHLAARREGRSDPDEATGLLTHHRVHDSACWAFISRFLDETRRHPAVQWMSPRSLFPAQ